MRLRFLPRGLGGIAGVVLALFVLVGRWELGRVLGGNGEPNVFLEPRLWVVFFSLIIATSAHLDTKALPSIGEMPAPWVMVFPLLFWIAISCLWSPDQELAVIKLYEVALVCIFLVALVLIMLRTDQSRVLDGMWSAIGLFTSAIALAALLQSTTGETGRMAVLGGGPNVFGRLMGLLLLWSLRQWRRSAPAIPTLSVGAVALLLVVFSGSRGALLAAIGALVVFVAMARLPIKKVATVGLVGFVIGIAVIYWTPVGVTISSVYVERFVELSIEQRYTSNRPELYNGAIGLASTHPALGAGLAGFAATGLHRYPHNIFLEILSENGVAGLSLLVFLLGVFAAHVLCSRRRIDPATGAAMVLFLISCQFSGDLFDSRNVFVFLVVCCHPKDLRARMLQPSQIT